MKSSSYTIGNRTRDLPGCSALPQPTVPQVGKFKGGKIILPHNLILMHVFQYVKLENLSITLFRVILRCIRYLIAIKHLVFFPNQ
jgi:hypothetical protein